MSSAAPSRCRKRPDPPPSQGAYATEAQSMPFELNPSGQCQTGIISAESSGFAPYTSGVVVTLSRRHR